MMSLPFGLFTQVSGSGPLGPLVIFSALWLNLCNNSDQTVFQCINVCQVPWELLKTSAFGLGFQQLPRDLANVNAWKTMFDPYIDRGKLLISQFLSQDYRRAKLVSTVKSSMGDIMLLRSLRCNAKDTR